MSLPADDPPAGPTPVRRAELADNLAAVRARLAAACAAAGRPVDAVRLVAVTKTFPATDVVGLADLGLTEVAENRDAEAAGKAAAVRAAGRSVRWHFVGQLQRNKCRSVVGYADLVQSVDRPRLVAALASAVRRYRGRPLDVLVQVSLDDVDVGGVPGATDRRAGRRDADAPGAPHGDRGAVTGRGGVPPEALPELVASVRAAPELRLRGLMAVAPRGVHPQRAFARLAEHAAWLRSVDHSARIVSAGMTGDLEQAVAQGATHVRVGSGLLGRRAPVG